MAFFNKINDIAKSVGDKTGEALETGKLNSKILNEKTAASEEFKKIGEYYYNVYVSGGEVAPEVMEFCQNAKGNYEAIEEAEAEIERIKVEGEAKRAAMAEAREQQAALKGKRFCTNCGAEVVAGAKFCAGCGNKME